MQLIALATDVFFATADSQAATEQGLQNMGLSPSTPYSWIETDTLQMLNHQVGSDDAALRCDDCHSSNNGRIDLVADRGYAKWGPTAVVCEQCHGPESMPDFEELHEKHVEDEGYDCSWCHDFTRSKRDLKTAHRSIDNHRRPESPGGDSVVLDSPTGVR